jgi:hypothetical protein
MTRAILTWYQYSSSMGFEIILNVYLPYTNIKFIFSIYHEKISLEIDAKLVWKSKQSAKILC